MKKLIVMLIVIGCGVQAVAEGPILECDVSRSGPRKDGRPGYEKIDEAKINTVIGERIELTQLIDLDVKTYIDGRGNYLLVLSDLKLGVSSTQMGHVSNKNINLSLSGQGYSNFITCEIK